jgi:hypothetical protein
MTKYTLATLAIAGILGGCKKDVTDANDIPDGATTGEIAVHLGGDSARAGGDGEVSSSVEEVWVRFEDVQILHENKGWISISDNREDIDLMTLRDGETASIGRAQTYEGAYDTLRLIVADSWIVVDGEESDLLIADGVELPDDEGISFQESFFVDEGTTTSLFVGWDLDTELSDDGEGWSLGTDAGVDVELNE